MFIPQDSRYDRYVISQSQFRVRCNDKVLPEYLVYYFHTPIGQHKLLSNASQVGVPHWQDHLRPFNRSKSNCLN